MEVAPPMNGVTRTLAKAAIRLPTRGPLDAWGPAASSSNDGSCMNSRKP